MFRQMVEKNLFNFIFLLIIVIILESASTHCSLFLQKRGHFHKSHLNDNELNGFFISVSFIVTFFMLGISQPFFLNEFSMVVTVIFNRSARHNPLTNSLHYCLGKISFLFVILLCLFSIFTIFFSCSSKKTTHAKKN